MHGSLSDGLDGHFVLSPPFAEPHQTELPTAQLLHEGQLAGVDLPLLWGGRKKVGKGKKEVKTDICDKRHINFRGALYSP